MTRNIKTTIPVLASLNFQETTAFYIEKLGFTVRGQFEDYLIISRDDAEIYFWQCEDRMISENTSCYIRTIGLWELYEEFNRRGLNVQSPKVQPWGMTELYVIDPHGNLLKFGEEEEVTRR